jgi:Protein of unknown function (DUF3300)
VSDLAAPCAPAFFPSPRGRPMDRLRACLWATVLSATVLAATPARAQEQRAQAAPVPGQAAVAPGPKAPPLSAEDLDRLVEPFAGAPQDTLGVVLDACRYPSDLLDAARWSQQPEGTRGAAKEAWPPTVRVLAERAPRTLEFLTRDLANTSALGSAYQNQPNDVWLAYGRVTARQTQAERHPAEARTAEGNRPPPPPPPPPAAAPRPAPNQQAAPAPASAPPAPPTPQVMAAQPPANPGPSAAGAAVVGGIVGLGAGLLISELADDDDGWGHGYPAPYAVPPPYMPYAGGGGRYDAARGLQESRQAAGRELQANRQSFAAAGREDRQSFTAEQRQQRQSADSQRQAQRQTARGDRQVQRQQSVQAGGGQRRDLATAGQSRSGERRVSPQRVASAHPAAQGGARRPEWGPTQGMSGDRLAAGRARQPPAGRPGDGMGARGGHPARR